MDWLWRLKRFAAFPKTLEDFRVKTCGGALELGKEEVFDPNSLDADGCESCCGAESEDVRCCNTCGDAREAYRRRGWAFKNPDSIEQRKREGFSQKMQEQKKEGCQVYGFLEVRKGFSRRVRKSGGKGLILRFVVWAGRKHAGWRSLAFRTV
ncbi:endoplasmic reticulum-Golgi intermediate compartment protein 3-like [Sarcoramphus papa]